MDKVSPLAHFTLEPGHEDYSFLHQADGDFEHCLDSIITDSVKTLEMDASFDGPDAVVSSFSLGFLHLVNTLYDYSEFQFAASIKNT